MHYDQSHSALETLLHSSKSHKIPKGQVMSLGDDRMFLIVIKSGYVKRYSITNDGTQSIQSIYGPGDIFPLTAVFRAIFDLDIYRGLEVFYYEAVTPVAVSAMTEQEVLEEVKDNPIICKDLLYVSGKRLSSNIQRLENAALKVANRKVAHQLVYYADKFGQKGETGATIMLPLTHQTIADVLNLARETVTHCITHLNDRGLIDIKAGSKITVLDIDKLKNEIH